MPDDFLIKRHCDLQLLEQYRRVERLVESGELEGGEKFDALNWLQKVKPHVAEFSLRPDFDKLHLWSYQLLSEIRRSERLPECSNPVLDHLLSFLKDAVAEPEDAEDAEDE